MTGADGTVYEDKNVEIEYKSQYQGPLGKLMM